MLPIRARDMRDMYEEYAECEQAYQRREGGVKAEVHASGIMAKPSHSGKAAGPTFPSRRASASPLPPPP
jgi:hypothetical protein